MDFIDLSTLAFAMIMSETATLLAFAMMLYFVRDEKAIPVWLAHKVLITLGLYTLFFRPHLHTETSIIITNLAIMSGYTFLWAGTRIFLRKPLILWLNITPVVLAMAIVLWFTFVEQSSLMRAFFSGMIYTLYSALTTVEYWRGDVEGKTTVRQRILGAILFFNTLTLFWYVLVLPLDIVQHDFFTTNLDVIRQQWTLTLFIDAFYSIGVVVVIYERLHAQNLETNTKLQDMLDEQKQFMLMLSHEFKNPLAAISRSAEFLETKLEPVPEHLRVRLRNIQDRVSTLDALVGMFLRYEVEQHAYEDNHFTEITLDELWREVCQYFDADILTQRVQDHVTAPRSRLLCDPILMSSAISTVLDNALKYSAPDGMVDACLGIEDGAAIIRIEDQGIGIPAQDLAIIPKRFYRSNNARTRPGSGLGLMLAKWVVERHAGHLQIESQENRGTTVTLSFPAHFG